MTVIYFSYSTGKKKRQFILQVDARRFDINIDLFYVSVSFNEPRYAYAVASALHGVQHILRKDFMLQVCIFSFNVLHRTVYFHFLIWLLSKSLKQYGHMHALKLF
jgi:hypothetical protein